MDEILKQLFGDFKNAIAISVIALLIAVVGIIPIPDGTGQFIVLENWQRYTIGGIGIAVPVLLTAFSIYSRRLQDAAEFRRSSKDYQRNFLIAQKQIRDIVPANELLAELELNDARIAVIVGDIVNAKTDVLVSSDDNHFRALGGVAKAILKTAGKDVEKQLAHYRRYISRQGDIVVTTGGQTDARVIIHPAVIDIDFDRFPDEQVIRKVLKRILLCAEMIGAKSVALPVLGGGTGSKHLKSSDVIKIILNQTIDHFKEESSLEYVVLYVFIGNDEQLRNEMRHEIAELFKSRISATSSV